jgi:hypothetical protein
MLWDSGEYVLSGLVDILRTEVLPLNSENALLDPVLLVGYVLRTE